MKRNLITVIPVFIACLVLNTCFSTAAIAALLATATAESTEAAETSAQAQVEVVAQAQVASPIKTTSATEAYSVTSDATEVLESSTASVTEIVSIAPDVRIASDVEIETANMSQVTVISVNESPDIKNLAVNNDVRVELLTWREASNLINGGTIISVEDIFTGLRYTLRCASISGHADVESLTAEDTDIIYRSRDGIWSWDARPVWVTIDGRTLAASINGNPHAGSTISDNNMNGHLCLHFTGTVTNSKSYQADLRNAIELAWGARLYINSIS